MRQIGPPSVQRGPRMRRYSKMLRTYMKKHVFFVHGVGSLNRKVASLSRGRNNGLSIVKISKSENETDRYNKYSTRSENEAKVEKG